MQKDAQDEDSESPRKGASKFRIPRLTHRRVTVRMLLLKPPITVVFVSEENGLEDDPDHHDSVHVVVCFARVGIVVVPCLVLFSRPLFLASNA